MNGFINSKQTSKFYRIANIQLDENFWLPFGFFVVRSLC